MEDRVKQLMQALDLSEDEARQIIADDDAIDHGADLFPLTAEQEKASKAARRTGTRAYTFTKRERKPDDDKHFLIESIVWMLTTDVNDIGDNVNATNVTVTNPERQVDFIFNGRRFRIVLSAPRTPSE